MRSLFLGARRKSGLGNYARLTLERLADRAAPSDLLHDSSDALFLLAPTPDPPLIAPPINQPPQITSFTATETTPGLYRFAGTVADESPEGMVITLTGPQDAVDGQTTTVHADGSFSIILQLRTDGTDAGTVQARTVDSGGLPSNVASVDVIPTISP